MKIYLQVSLANMVCSSWKAYFSHRKILLHIFFPLFKYMNYLNSGFLFWCLWKEWYFHICDSVIWNYPICAKTLKAEIRSLSLTSWHLLKVFKDVHVKLTPCSSRTIFFHTTSRTSPIIIIKGCSRKHNQRNCSLFL